MYFIPSLINILVVLNLSKKLLNEKINLKNYKLYISILIFWLLVSFNSLYIDKYISLISMTFVVFFINIFLFKKDVKTIMILSFYQQFLVSISELLFSIIFSIFLNFDANKMTNNFHYIILCNFFISLILFIISRTKYVIKIYNGLIRITKKIKIQTILIYILILIISINVLTFLVYFKTKILILLIFNIIFFSIYLFILLIAFKEKSVNIKFKNEKKNLISSLNEYEKMLDYQRVNNHENKNQLLVIKSMVEKKDEKLLDYINEIIKEKREDNEIIYTKAKRIPSGGLQGLIYQKMLLMQEKNIEVNLDINSQVRKIDFSNLSSKMNYDICRIAGIIIDNAIEETSKFNKKEREIIISMYVDDMFVIEVSNRIKDNVDLSEIYKKGYTSKEKGHGYGLSLLKKIVDENEKIINEVKIMNDIFTQIIKIKM